MADGDGLNTFAAVHVAYRQRVIAGREVGVVRRGYAITPLVGDGPCSAFDQCAGRAVRFVKAGGVAGCDRHRQVNAATNDDTGFLRTVVRVGHSHLVGTGGQVIAACFRAGVGPDYFVGRCAAANSQLRRSVGDAANSVGRRSRYGDLLGLGDRHVDDLGTAVGVGDDDAIVAGLEARVSGRRYAVVPTVSERSSRAGGRYRSAAVAAAKAGDVGHPHLGGQVTPAADGNLRFFGTTVRIGHG